TCGARTGRTGLMPSKWAPIAAGAAVGFNGVNLGFCPANHNFIAVLVKPPAANWKLLSQRCTWQTAGEALIDGPRPEDGTNFSSHAAGALPDFPWCDCRGVVVAGHADHPGARADRSQCQAAMRVLCAV